MSKEQNRPGIERRRFRPYPKYKDSGVEWLGKIPAHWEARRLKTIASVQLSNVDKKSVEGQESVKLCNYLDVYYNDFISSDMDFMPATATPEQVRRFSLQAGDVLITKDSESWTDIAVSALVTSDLPDVLCGYHLALVRPTQEDTGGFLAKAFSAIGPRDQFQIVANGITRFGLGGDAIRTSMFAMPPIQEQRAITYFLDRGTARIDELIEKKERLIELLQEKRTALITQAVTKGLDLTVPMNDSGVEWLGKIPAHWEAKRLKFTSFINMGQSPSSDIVNTTGEGLAFLQGNADFGIENPAPQTFCPAPPKIAKPGDILLSVRAPVGALNIADQKYGIGRGLCAISANSQILERAYCQYVLQIAHSQLDEIAKGSTYDAVSSYEVSSLLIPLPPIKEQHNIASYIALETAIIDALVAKIQEAIAFLNEYRIALISASVTGKIDVRDPGYSSMPQ